MKRKFVACLTAIPGRWSRSTGGRSSTVNVYDEQWCVKKVFKNRWSLLTVVSQPGSTVTSCGASDNLICTFGYCYEKAWC